MGWGNTQNPKSREIYHNRNFLSLKDKWLFRNKSYKINCITNRSQRLQIFYNIRQKFHKEFKIRDLIKVKSKLFTQGIGFISPNSQYQQGYFNEIF